MRCGIKVSCMGTLRWDGWDARSCIEKCRRIFARLNRFKPDEVVGEDRTNVSRETYSRKPAHCPLYCATESPPQGRRIYPAHVSAARPKTARGWLHVQLVQAAIRTSPRRSPHSPAERPRVQRRLLFHKIQTQIPHRMSTRYRQTSIHSSLISLRAAG